MSYILATDGYVECGVFAESGPLPTPTKQKNLFKEAEQMVNAIRTEYGTVEIIYEQNEVESETLCATPAKTVFVYFDRHNISQRKESRDYLLNVTDLIVATVRVKPKEGDLIHEVVDSVRYTYRVSSPGKEPDWRYSGHYRTAYRIHSKLIKEEVI